MATGNDEKSTETGVTQFDARLEIKIEVSKDLFKLSSIWKIINLLHTLCTPFTYIKIRNCTCL